MSAFALQTSPAADRTLERLPGAVAAAIVEFITGPLLDDPYRIGKPLREPYAGLYCARRGAYRVMYQVREPGLVLVVRIDHRADIYRPR